MARDYMLHANHYSHVMDAAVELLDIAAGESGEKQKSMFGLCARFFNVAAHAEVRCHQLYHMNLADRDEANKATAFIGKQPLPDVACRPPVLPETLALQKHMQTTTTRPSGGASSSGRGGREGRRGKKRRFNGGGVSGGVQKK